MWAGTTSQTTSQANAPLKAARRTATGMDAGYSGPVYGLIRQVNWPKTIISLNTLTALQGQYWPSRAFFKDESEAEDRGELLANFSEWGPAEDPANHSDWESWVNRKAHNAL